MRDTGFERAEAHEFVFDLYASGEYTTMLGTKLERVTSFFVR